MKLRREGLKKVDCVVHKSVLRNSKIQSNFTMIIADASTVEHTLWFR